MSSLEKVLGDWGGGMGGLQQQEGSGSGSGSGSVGTVRALLLGSPSSGRTQFRQACATLYSNQPARPQSQLNHAADRLPLLRDRVSQVSSSAVAIVDGLLKKSLTVGPRLRLSSIRLVV